MHSLNILSRHRAGSSYVFKRFKAICHRALDMHWPALVLILGTFLTTGPMAFAGGETVTFVGAQVSIPTSHPSTPLSVAVDANGVVYIGDGASHQVLIETPQADGSYVESVLPSASFQNPSGVAVDASNNIYVADASAHALFKETPSGTGYTESVVSSTYTPISVAVDSSGNVYLCDGSMTLHRVTLTGGVYQDAPGVFFGGHEAWSVAVDGSGNVYITDPANGVYKETPSGGIYSDAVVSSAFGYPANVAVDTQGNLYVADASFSQLYVETPSGGSYSQSVIPANGLNAPQGVAVDSKGNLYIADTSNSRIVKFTPSAHMGRVNVGGTSGVVSMIFQFGGASGSFASTAFLTQGASNLDFADAGTGNCFSSTFYDDGNTCTVDVRMTPTAPGLRMGAVQLLDGSGNILVTGYVNGVGVGPQANFLPGVASTLGGGFTLPFGLTVDADGNIYVTDWANHAVSEMPAGCTSSSCVTTLGGGFINPYGVAVDGAGNVYVADDAATTVSVMPPGCASSACVTTLVSGYARVDGLAVDGGGNVYFTVRSSDAVIEMPVGCTSSSCVTSLGGGFNSPFGVAVDQSGNVYVADMANSAVKVMPAGCTSALCVTTLGGGFNAPYGVAVDGKGNVFIADTFNGVWKKMRSDCTSASCVTWMGTITAYGLALDATGKVYVGDINANKVWKLDYSYPPSVNFVTPTNVGSVDTTDGEQSVTVENIGNAELSFSQISVAANFSLGGADTTCSTSSPLAASGTCILGIEFAPTTAGNISGSVALTDNALNNNSSTQTINLFGIGQIIVSQADTTATAVSVSPGSPQAGSSATITATVTDSTNAGTVPTGPVTFTDAVNGGSASPLNGGAAVILDGSGIATLAGVVLSGTAGDVHTITASYAGVSGTFASSSGKASATLAAIAATATGSSPLNLGSVNVASAANGTVTFTFSAPGAIGTPVVITQGIAGLDFVVAGTGTCTTNGTTHVYNTNDTCTVDVTFTPKYPGPRYGAVVLKDASGNVLATVYLSGTGLGPQVIFSPATALVVVDGSKFDSPVGLSVDTAGNIYVADTWNDRLVKETLSSGTYTRSTIFTGQGRVYGGRVDGAGNVYVSDCRNYEILKLPWNGSSYGTPVNIADWNSTGVVWCPTDMVADSHGNLFVTDYYQTYIYEIPLTDGTYGAPIPIGSGFNKPYGIAVDIQGNLFVSDWRNDRVVEVPWTGSGYGALIVLASGTGSPVGLGLDNRGNVYVANEDNNTVSVISKVGNGFGPVTTLSGNYLDAPQGLGLDTSGNIFLVNYTDGNVVKLAVSDPPSLQFAATEVGATSSDSPQTVSLQNIGNAPLTFAIPNAGTNPSISADFQLNSNGGSGCPVTDSSANSGATLAAGASCDLAISFVPTAAGPISGGLVLKDDSLKTQATQLVALSGVATAAPTTPTAVTFSMSPNPATFGQLITFSANVSPIPTGGTVDFSYSRTLVCTAAVDGSGNATCATSILPAGVYDVYASYSGATGFSYSYAASQTLTINAAVTSTTTTLAISPNPATVGQTIFLGATISPTPVIGPYGTVSFYDGQTLLGTASVGTGCVVNNSIVASTAIAKRTLVQAANSGPTSPCGMAIYATNSLPAGRYRVTAVYSGNSGFATSTSVAVSLTVNAATVPSASTTTLTSSPSTGMAGMPVTLTATISPASAGGTVSFYDGTTLLGTATVDSSGVVTFTTSALAMGTYSLTAVYSGSATIASSTSSALSLTIGAGYTVTAPPTQSVPAGGSADITVTVPPLGGAFNQPVTMSASGLPAGATATFNPPVVIPGANGASTVLTIHLSGISAAMPSRNGRFPFALFGVALGLCGVVVLPLKRFSRKSALRAVTVGVLAVTIVMATGCSGGFWGGSKVQPGSYVVTITGASGSFHASTQVTVLIK